MHKYDEKAIASITRVKRSLRLIAGLHRTETAKTVLVPRTSSWSPHRCAAIISRFSDVQLGGYDDGSAVLSRDELALSSEQGGALER